MKNALPSTVQFCSTYLSFNADGTAKASWRVFPPQPKAKHQTRRDRYHKGGLRTEARRRGECLHRRHNQIGRKTVGIRLHATHMKRFKRVNIKIDELSRSFSALQDDQTAILKQIREMVFEMKHPSNKPSPKPRLIEKPSSMFKPSSMYEMKHPSNKTSPKPRLIGKPSRRSST